MDNEHQVEIDEDEDLDEDLDREIPESGGGEGEDNRDDLPDDLLSEEERTAKAERKRRKDEEDAAKRRSDEDSRLTRVISEAFAGVSSRQSERTEQPAPTPPQRRLLTPEERAKVNQRILEEPDGIVKAVEWAEQRAYERATQDFTQRTGPAAAILGESVAERFVARKLREESLGKQIEPFFNSVLDGFDLSGLAGMTQEARKQTLDDLWDVAAGRLLRQKGRVRTQVSPGVGRGAGGSGRMQRRRQKYKLSDKEKADMMASATTEEGKARMRRAILEIENGVITDPAIARMVDDSVRFAENTGAAI